MRNRSLFEIDNDPKLPQPWVTPVVVNGNPYTNAISVRAFREAQLTVKPADVDVVAWALLTEELPSEPESYVLFSGDYNNIIGIVTKTGMGCVAETGKRVGELARWVDAQGRKHLGVILGFVPPRITVPAACREVLQRVPLSQRRFQSESVKSYTRALVCCSKLDGNKYYAVQLSKLEGVEC